MAYGRIWPVHPHPLPDELLSSWIVRVARGNGIKLQTLTRMLFGTDRTPWNRDIDRSAPSWVLNAFSEHTGIHRPLLVRRTLRAYRGRLFSDVPLSGQLKWILPVRSNGTKRAAFGMQFCPDCLATDEVPYFRKRWRVAFYTYCPVHQIELYDACPACGSPVAHFRGDFNRELSAALPMSSCHMCGQDFRVTERHPVVIPCHRLHATFDRLLLSLHEGKPTPPIFDVEHLAVMHQLVRVMGMKRNRSKLLRYVAEHVGLPVVSLPSRRESVEERRRDERHYWSLCGLWFMDDVGDHLREVCETRKVLYSEFLSDFDGAPGWYRTIVDRLPHRGDAL